MNGMVLLDTGPLGMFTTRGANLKNQECVRRVTGLIAAGAEVRAVGIADYENRRKLEHLDRKHPPAIRVARLATAVRLLGLLPTTDDVLNKAAEIWGHARHRAVASVPVEAIDGDSIMVAHAAIEFARTGVPVQIATCNSSDIQRLLNLGYPGTVLNWDDLKK
jgi:hypothetical protein